MIIVLFEEWNTDYNFACWESHFKTFDDNQMEIAVKLVKEYRSNPKWYANVKMFFATETFIEMTPEEEGKSQGERFAILEIRYDFEQRKLVEFNRIKRFTAECSEFINEMKRKHLLSGVPISV